MLSMPKLILNFEIIYDQCSPHTRTSQLSWSANQLSGFCTIETFAVKFFIIVIIVVVITIR